MDLTSNWHPKWHWEVVFQESMERFVLQTNRVLNRLPPKEEYSLSTQDSGVEQQHYFPVEEAMPTRRRIHQSRQYRR